MCSLPRGPSSGTTDHPGAAGPAACFIYKYSGLPPPLNVNAILYLHTHPVILILFSFPPPPFFVCFVSSCLTGFLTVVCQVSPMWGPWGQAFPLIACLPPACSLGSPLSTFQTTLIITPLGPACSRHLRSLAGRFVSLLPPLFPSSPFMALCSPLFCPTVLILTAPPLAPSFHTLPSSPYNTSP